MKKIAVLSSSIALITGLLWWLVPATYPFGPHDRVLALSNLLDHRAGGLVAMLAGVAGLVAVSAAPRIVRRCLVVAQLLVFGAVFSDAGIFSVLGYLLALLGPPAVVAVVVLACVRGRRAGFVALAVLLVLVGLGVATGLLGPGNVTAYAHNLAVGFGTFVGRLAWTFADAAMFGVWLSVAAREWPVSLPGSWRWGRVVTIAAALCPLPYALFRLTWLTPWPVGYGGDGRPLTLDVRLQGSLIGIGAVIGAVLTIGLISRWGEVWPRWVPFGAGRPIPVRFPAAAGGTVAVAAALASSGLVVGAIRAGEPLILLLFPYPVWSVLLGAAVLAYWRRRTLDPVG